MSKNKRLTNRDIDNTLNEGIMRQSTPNEQVQNTVPPLSQSASASVLGLALLGFVLLITGVVMFVMTTIEALTQHEDTRTIISILVGLTMYRAGKLVLQKVWKFKLPPDRRRSVLS